MAKNPHLREINDFQLLLEYLEEHLHWPLDGYTFDDLTFTYEPEELGLKEEDAVHVRTIRQLRPIEDGQPWGIFFVEFEKKKLPVVLLRRILSHLVLKKRESANSAERKRWHAKDILFVTQFDGVGNEHELAFAHFKEAQGDLPTLNVLGWDGGDTVLKINYVREQLEAHLRWPDDTRDVEKWRAEWSKPFRHGVRHTIRTADALAEAMAELARRIRDAASALMRVESEKGPLRRMHAAFKTALIHDLTEEGFADTYAQTITYGLLTAAISRTDMQGGKYGTTVVPNMIVDMVPVTNPFLKEMLQSFLKVGGRKRGIDFDELGVQDVVHLFRSDETDLPAIIRDFGNKTGGEDPVIHFYEHFLAKYNKKLKVERGVFYTPKPVVGYIVRSVDELLRTEFGIEDGLASTITWREMAARNSALKIPEGTEPDSPFVVVLDPATGTATFLVEVIDVIHKHLVAKWKQGGLKAMPKLPSTAFPRQAEDFKDYWNQYVPLSLLRRLHGYELMMAPYAIAHMKIGLKLWETGYRFGTEERARIYLTNAIEQAEDFSGKFEFAIPALAHEGQAVNEVKRKQRFTVVVGNPPYSNFGMMNRIPFILRLLDEYKRDLREKKLNLDDDYIKFIRFGQELVRNTGEGILAYISNNSYVDGIVHRRMRESLVETFNTAFILNLHGDARKREKDPAGGKDENVFDIAQGVAISLFIKTGRTPTSEHASVHYRDFHGEREVKYNLLQTCGLEPDAWSMPVPTAPRFLLTPTDHTLRREYEKGYSLSKLFPIGNSGIQTKRDDVAVSFTQREAERVIEVFRTCTPPEIRRKLNLPDDGRDWQVAWAKADLEKGYQVLPISYRPLDLRYMPYTGRSKGIVAYPRESTSKHVIGQRNVVLVACRQMKEEVGAFVANGLIDQKTFSAYDICTGYPLYLFPDLSRQTRVIAQGVEPNLNALLVKQLAGSMGLRYANDPDNLWLHGIGSLMTALDLFDYCYAVLHSFGYRLKYKEFLKSDFPRIPFPYDGKLFRALVQLGAQLRKLHLLESEARSITTFPVAGSNEVLRRMGQNDYADGKVWINDTQYFAGVPEAAWNFYIGGYQPAQKWLKDRKGRTLSAEDIAHYKKIVVALSETIRIQKEIDEVIEQHGGWPGAFATGVALDAAAPPAATGPTATKPKKPKANPSTPLRAGEASEPEEASSPGYIPDPGEIPFA